jgi:Transposase DDE domain
MLRGPSGGLDIPWGVARSKAAYAHGCPIVICDQRVMLNGRRTSAKYPEHLRRIRFKDPDSGKVLIFLTNNTALPAHTIAALYKSRWQVELFFKWIKQHLRIKRFLATSENAVKTQIWCAIATYLLIAIIKKELQLDASLYTCLQILSVSVFLISYALPQSTSQSDLDPYANQLVCSTSNRALVPERAEAIFIAYRYAVKTRIGPTWVGAARAARLIGVSRSRVQSMARTGELRTLTGRPYHFFERDLLKWIVAQPTNPPELMLWPPTDPDRPRKPKRSA